MQPAVELDRVSKSFRVRRAPRPGGGGRFRDLFRPQTQAQSWSEAPPDLHACDVWLDLPGGVRAHAWLCEPQEWLPEHGATHYSHGNAGNLSQRAEGVRRWMTLMRQAVASITANIQVDSRKATLTSSLCSNDRLSTLVVPITADTPSIISALT